MTRPQNSQIEQLADCFMTLAGPNDWTAKRRASARRLLIRLLDQAFKRGAAAAHVSHDRRAEADQLACVIGLVGFVDPGLIPDAPGVDRAEEMQALIISALTAFQRGRVAA